MQEKENQISKTQGHATYNGALETMMSTHLCQKLQLLPGRVPRQLLSVEDNLDEEDVKADPQTRWACHYKTMEAVKDSFIAVETDPIAKKAPNQKGNQEKHGFGVRHKHVYPSRPGLQIQFSTYILLIF